MLIIQMYEQFPVHNCRTTYIVGCDANKRLVFMTCDLPCPVKSPAARREAGQLLHAWQLSDAAQYIQSGQGQTTALLRPKPGQQRDVRDRRQHQPLQWGPFHLSSSTASQKYRYLLLSPSTLVEYTSWSNVCGHLNLGGKPCLHGAEALCTRASSCNRNEMK